MLHCVILFYREKSYSHNLIFIKHNPLSLQPVSVFTKYTFAATKLQFEVLLIIIGACLRVCVFVWVWVHVYVHSTYMCGWVGVEFNKPLAYSWCMRDNGLCFFMWVLFACFTSCFWTHDRIMCLDKNTISFCHHQIKFQLWCTI